jgi:DNA transformation protein and related proteins
MASDPDFLAYVLDQIDPLLAGGPVSSRRMFGEYALYSSEAKVVALLCDNRLYLKSTPAGVQYCAGAATPAAPFPGAKDWLRIDEALEDRAWISTLIRLTAQALPLPKPRKPRHPTRKRKDPP